MYDEQKFNYYTINTGRKKKTKLCKKDYQNEQMQYNGETIFKIERKEMKKRWWSEGEKKTFIYTHSHRNVTTKIKQQKKKEKRNIKDKHEKRVKTN